MTVLFLSDRPMPRCENITAVYNAYQGEKIFDRSSGRTSKYLREGDYDLVVTDELVKESKAPVILIFHGIGLAKTFLLQRSYNKTNADILNGSKLISYAVTSSDSAISTMTTSFQCGIKQDKILPLGMPRTDILINYKPEGKLMDLWKWKYKYLYVPTFRDLNDTDIPEINLDELDKMLSDDEIFMVKPHMVMKNHLNKDEYKHIKFISQDEPSIPYICESDVIVTDYSSILFDAHIISKPVVLFEKDADRYLIEPGMCMAYPESYASRHTQNEKELVDLMRQAAIFGPKEADLKCKELATNMCDGHSTERVCDLIDKMLEDYCV